VLRSLSQRNVTTTPVWILLLLSTSVSQCILHVLVLVMIDDLNGPGCDNHKYVDDTTITEIGHSSSTSHMHEYLDNLLLWTQENDMKIYISKTKELLMGPWVGVISHRYKPYLV